MSNSLLTFLFLSCVYFQSSLALTQTTLPFVDGFNVLYGETNVVPYDGNRSVQLIMDKRSSSGFKSKLMYMNGNFEAFIKLPENYSAGVVVTFYLSNNQKFPYYHDEIDFEFLGHVNGQQWTVQTNFYGNGSTNKGREERYVLWFNPSDDLHRYGIQWNENRITYYVDNVPIRHVMKIDDGITDFPSKEMSLYGTIWNGSDWATNGGRSKLDLSYGPYIAKFSNFGINGCASDPALNETHCNEDNPVFTQLSNEMMTFRERNLMENFRKKYMTYSYCYDKKRYAIPLPECVIKHEELAHLQKLDQWTFGSSNPIGK